MMHRRTFLQTGAAACLASCSRSQEITGSIVGANHAAGHWLRDLKSPPTPSRTEKADVVIAGGGISGLMAALRLHEAGVAKITVLDLEAEPGGNARCGQNAITSYPWGAHYVPLPNHDATEVCQLFEELGIITGHDAAGRAIHDERYLCADQQERLYVHGVWQEGLGPVIGTTAAERDEMARFTARMNEIKQKRGRDGRRLFAIPVDQSSEDEEWLSLDQMTMEAWMQREGFTCEPLRWYVNYGCRDDYGAGIAQVSAWAGLHYFCARDDGEVLTWPEGNAWIVKRILERMPGVTFSRAVVWRMTNEADGVTVDGFDPVTQEAVRWQARAAVCAMPRFVAQRVVQGLDPMTTLQYSPWAVVNMTWRGEPPPAWDSVFRESSALGYVVATHQSLHPFPRDSVLTWYQSLDHLPPAEARQQALNKPWSAWRDEVLADMRPAHPDVAQRVSNLDVMLWGHGMIRPVPGFISSAGRRQMAQPLGRIVFAHSDMSGISIFEEACTRGAQAARSVKSILDG
jgi:monoamine oxidase